MHLTQEIDTSDPLRSKPAPVANPLDIGQFLTLVVVVRDPGTEEERDLANLVSLIAKPWPGLTETVAALEEECASSPVLTTPLKRVPRSSKQTTPGPEKHQSMINTNNNNNGNCCYNI
jgi:hypothetical protein